MRTLFTAAALALGLALAGCDSFDPLDKCPGLDIMGTRRSRCRASAAPVFRMACPACRRACRPTW